MFHWQRRERVAASRPDHRAVMGRQCLQASIKGGTFRCDLCHPAHTGEQGSRVLKRCQVKIGQRVDQLIAGQPELAMGDEIDDDFGLSGAQPVAFKLQSAAIALSTAPSSSVGAGACRPHPEVTAREQPLPRTPAFRGWARKCIGALSRSY